MAKVDRRRQILEAYASMLESLPGQRITTAALAGELGVSEAALYRHFPTKAKMIDGLLDFVEETVFSRVASIVKSGREPEETCRTIIRLLLGFCETNPGFARVLTGDALIGETVRLRERVRQFFDRIETDLRQQMRRAHSGRAHPATVPPDTVANLFLASAEGRIAQFVRTQFKALPTQGWDHQWALIARAAF